MGPLNGIKIIEMGGIGPGPFCAMMLADMGAEIVRIDRLSTKADNADRAKYEIMHRGRKSIAIDLKKEAGVAVILKLVSQAEALVEGFRPGVMERLGLGPDDCLKQNPGLVYGRMTGWGQEGPLARAAGHDINYISLSGALHSIGRADKKPVPPLNLVGDYGGGGMLLAFGMVCALLEGRKSGKGQVVDAAMVDGAAILMAQVYGLFAEGFWKDQRGMNLLDTGAYFYDAYETADGKWISIGSLEPQFYKLLLDLAGIDDPDFNSQGDSSQWPRLKEKMTNIFKTRTRDEWCRIMEGTDVCFAPVLSLEEAKNHRHNEARKTFVEIDGVVHPAPAPRFSRTAATIQSPPPTPGEHSEKALAEWGFSQEEIASLKTSKII